MGIVISGLSKRFAPHLPPALQNIEANLPPGKMVGLVGSDGSGKTTLLRLIAALLLPTEGSIMVAGCDTVANPEEIHRLTSYMPQRFGLYEDLTVLQNLELYADLRGVMGAARETAFEKLLRFTGLSPFQKRFAGNLSGGMKQKLGLACALIKKPSLLLLDEPSVGVDPLSRRELWSLVRGLLGEGISVLWSTSYLDEAERCDSVLLLHRGKMLYAGSPQEFTKRFAKPCFEDAFIDLLGGFSEGESLLAQGMPLVVNECKTPIVAKSLVKHFGTFAAVDGINFAVRKGEIFGLLGPNGAGKSTTFKMLCGLLTPTSGAAFVAGLDLKKAPSLARSKIGYMAQKFSLYEQLSCLQNLQFFSGVYNLSGSLQKDKVSEMISIFSLEPYLDRSSQNLSLGVKQRLALACATMHDPIVLFLDEPTSGVDPLTRREFWRHIKGLVKKGVTILISTHFMDEAVYCDRIALIHRGRILHEGTPDALKKLAESATIPKPTLEDAFIALIQDDVKQHP